MPWSRNREMDAGAGLPFSFLPFYSVPSFKLIQDAAYDQTGPPTSDLSGNVFRDLSSAATSSHSKFIKADDGD